MIRDAIVIGLPCAVLLAAVVGVEHADFDLWGRLSVGAVLFEAGHVPRVEDFSFTAQGRPWIDHEWLAGVVFYLVLWSGGAGALSLLKSAAAIASIALAAAASRAHREGADALHPPWTAALLATLLTPVMLIGWITTVRAQVFSFVGFAYTLWVLESVRTGRFARGAGGRSELGHLAGLVVFAIFWGNAHGGFVMGAMAVGLYALAAAFEGARARAGRQALAAVAMVAGVVRINPFGPVYGQFLLHAWTLDRSAITEWAPLWEAPPGIPRALALAAAAGAFGLAALRGLGAVRSVWMAPVGASPRASTADSASS
ncbi:MAG: hypothetical protein AAF471_07750, partial [Myxococcota bacterium]